MKKKWALCLALIVLTAAIPVATFADQAINIVVNGSYLQMTNKPVLINDRVYLPIREISEALNAQVGWDPATYTVNIQTAQQPAVTTPPTTPPATTTSSIPGTGKYIRLNGKLTTWPYWVKNGRLFLEYRDAISLLRTSTGDRLYNMSYYKDSGIFVFNNDSMTVDPETDGEYTLLNITKIDQYFPNITMEVNMDTGEITTPYNQM